jgi:hypothetical protein
MGPVFAFFYPRRGPRNGSSRKPVESIGNLQDRIPCAGIGQLPSHLPRLLGSIEPFQGFIPDRHHRVLPSLLEGGPLPARPSLATDFPYRNHAVVSDETARHIPAQSPSDKNRDNRSPAPGVSFVAVAAGLDRD